MNDKTKPRRNAPRKRTPVQQAARQQPSNRDRRRDALEQQGRAAARPIYPEPEDDACYKP